MAPAGSGMAETQGTSAMSLYNGHTGQASVGLDTAQELHSYEMGQRQKMTPPTGGQGASVYRNCAM